MTETARYCSKACQKTDWARRNMVGHKQFCRHLGTMRQRVEAAAVAADPADNEESGGAPPAAALFRPASAESFRRYKLGCLHVLEDVLQRPADDVESLPVLFQRHCGYCLSVQHGLPDEAAAEWVTCTGCSIVQWCGPTCHQTGRGGHAEGSCAHYRLLLGCAQAVARSMEAADCPPPWAPRAQPLYVPLPHGWGAFFDEAITNPQNAKKWSSVDKALATQDLGLPLLAEWSLERCGVRHSRSGRHREGRRDRLMERKRLVVHIVDPAAEDCLGLRRWAVLFSRLPALEHIDLLITGPNIRPDTLSESVVPKTLRKRKPDAVHRTVQQDGATTHTGHGISSDNVAAQDRISAQQPCSVAPSSMMLTSDKHETVAGNRYESAAPAGLAAQGPISSTPIRKPSLHTEAVVDVAQRGKNCTQMLHELCQKMKWSCSYSDLQTEAPESFRMDITVYDQDRVRNATAGTACRTKREAKSSAAEVWLMNWNRTFPAGSVPALLSGQSVTQDVDQPEPNAEAAPRTQHLAVEPPLWAVAQLMEFVHDVEKLELLFAATALTPDERNLVRIAAADHGLKAKSRGKGDERHLVVLRMAPGLESSAQAAGPPSHTRESPAANVEGFAPTSDSRPARLEDERRLDGSQACTDGGWGQTYTLDDIGEEAFVDVQDLRQQWATVTLSAAVGSTATLEGCDESVVNGWEKASSVSLTEALDVKEFEWLRGAFDRKDRRKNAAGPTAAPTAAPAAAPAAGSGARKAGDRVAGADTDPVPSVAGPGDSAGANPDLCCEPEPEPSAPVEVQEEKSSCSVVTGSDTDDDSDDNFIAEYPGLDAVEILLPQFENAERCRQLRVAYYMGAYSDLVGVRGFATPDVMLCMQRDSKCAPDDGAVVATHMHWGTVLSTLAASNSLMLFPTTSFAEAAGVEQWIESWPREICGVVLPAQPNRFGSLRPVMDPMTSHCESQLSYEWSYIVVAGSTKGQIDAGL